MPSILSKLVLLLVVARSRTKNLAATTSTVESCRYCRRFFEDHNTVHIVRRKEGLAYRASSAISSAENANS